MRVSEERRTLGGTNQSIVIRGRQKSTETRKEEIQETPEDMERDGESTTNGGRKLETGKEE